MIQRKGLCAGSGKRGYYNMMPKDSYIHALSAKGIHSNKCFASNPVYKTVKYNQIKPIDDGTLVYDGKMYGSKDDLKYMPDKVRLVKLDAKNEMKNYIISGTGFLYQYDVKARNEQEAIEKADKDLKGALTKHMETGGDIDVTQVKKTKDGWKNVLDAKGKVWDNIVCSKCGRTFQGIKGYHTICTKCSMGFDVELTNELKASGSFDAGVVLQQLGGNKFIAMTGAKDFSRNDDKQQIGFKIGRNARNVNYVRITLNSMDTYDMEFLNVSVKGSKVKSKVDGVYNDHLQEIFTANTGMHTSLFAKKDWKPIGDGDAFITKDGNKMVHISTIQDRDGKNAFLYTAKVEPYRQALNPKWAKKSYKIAQGRDYKKVRAKAKEYMQVHAKSKEYIKGGLGDGKKNSDFSKRQMKMGAKVEMEHTTNPKIAQEISRDHLSEFANYYTELAKAEKRMKK